MMITVVSTFVALTLLSAVTRMGPLLFGKWMEKQPWIRRLGLQLPSMILVLLLLYDCKNRFGMPETSGIAIVLGLIATLAVQHWKQTPIFSIAVGVIVHALIRFIIS